MARKKRATSKTLASEVRRNMPAQKKTCIICFDDYFKDEQMFSVALCGHQFCVECVKRHIEVRLLEGSLMRCLHSGCNSELTFKSCANLLTPNLRAMWKVRIKEDSIPLKKRIYCPNPRCSALMSKTKLSKSSKEAGVRRCCVKCGEPFCISCKVPWHKHLSCNDYKMLHPNPTENDGKLKALANKKMWRQCGKCQHMIELSQGCVHVKCRCGYEFCYQCGAKTGGCRHGHGPYVMPQPPPSPRPQPPEHVMMHI